MSDFYLLITDAGKALEAAAHASGETVKLTDFAVGDGGGAAITPDAAQTALVNETFRDAISSLTVSTADNTVLEAECIIPKESGGYTIREIGIYADDGTLYAVGNFAEQEKPAPDSGYAASLQIIADLAVSDTSDITLTVQDASYLTETQANTIYLRQDKRLSEIADEGEDAQAEARLNLGIGSVSTEDVVTSMTDETAGRIPVVGWEGMGGIAVSIPDTDIMSTQALGGRVFKQGNGSTEKHFGSYGCGMHMLYGTSGDGTQRLTANLFVDASGNLTTEFLAIKIADGTVISQNKHQYLQITGGILSGALHINYDGEAIELKPKTAGYASYIMSRNSAGETQWYVGKGSNNNDDAVFNNYKGGSNNIVLRADGSITINATNSKDIIANAAIVGDDIGRGSYASQNGGRAPFYQEVNTTATSEYWPIIKQHYTQGNATWSMGQTVSEGSWHLFFISASDTAGKNFTWQKDGQFIPPNYSNFDDRYVGDIHFGASTSHSVSNNQSFSTAGYSLTGYNCDGSNDDLDTLYAKVIQKYNRRTAVWTTIAG